MNISNGPPKRRIKRFRWLRCSGVASVGGAAGSEGVAGADGASDAGGACVIGGTSKI